MAPPIKLKGIAHALPLTKRAAKYLEDYKGKQATKVNRALKQLREVTEALEEVESK
jgi:hypothetical protein